MDQNKCDIRELYELENFGVGGATCGSCNPMATANSMGCVAEALGISVPGNGTVPAVFSERLRLAKYAGKRAVLPGRGGPEEPAGRRDP